MNSGEYGLHSLCLGKKKSLVVLHQLTLICRAYPFFFFLIKKKKMLTPKQTKDLVVFIKYSQQAILLCDKPFDHLKILVLDFT